MNEPKVERIVTNPMEQKGLIINGKLYTPKMVKKLEEENKNLEEKLKLATDYISNLNFDTSSVDTKIDNLIEDFRSECGITTDANTIFTSSESEASI